MKKRILLVLTSMMLALGFATVAAPKTEVKADTSSYYTMTYDEVVNYWSSTPLWQTIYDAEKNNAGYYSPLTDSKVEYFKARFVDVVLHPDMVRAQTPLTYNYIKDVISFSNPCITNLIYGYTSYTLKDKLRDELNTINNTYRFTSSSPEVEALYNYLCSQGVTTVDAYRTWSDYHKTNAWGAYWNCYGKNCWTAPYYAWNYRYPYYCAPVVNPWAYGYYATVNYATNEVLRSVGEVCAETYVNNLQQIDNFQSVQEEVMNNVQAVQNQIAEISAQFPMPQ